jgi:hypothetical protein
VQTGVQHRRTGRTSRGCAEQLGPRHEPMPGGGGDASQRFGALATARPVSLLASKVTPATPAAQI